MSEEFAYEVKRHIGWACVWSGYRVTVYEGSRVLYSYSAGNHRGESQTYVAEGSPNATPLAELRALARRTIAQLRAEYGVHRDDIHEYDDMAIELLQESQADVGG